MKEKRIEETSCKKVRKELASAAGEKVDRPSLLHLKQCRECRLFAADCRRLAEGGRKILETGSSFHGSDALRLARQAKARVTEAGWLEELPRWTMPALSASFSTTVCILVLGLGTGTRPEPALRSSSSPSSVPMVASATRKTSVGSSSAGSSLLQRVASPRIAATEIQERAAMPDDLLALCRYFDVPSTSTRSGALPLTDGGQNRAPDAGLLSNKKRSSRSQEKTKEVEP